MSGRPGMAAAALLAAVAAQAHETHGHEGGGHAVAGPADAYAFPLPEPGSYALPPIRAAGGGAVLLEDGRAADLETLLGGRITVFSFIYTRCPDLCPIATLRLADLHALAAADEEVAARLQLVSMSFDPGHDTPAVMADYAAAWRGEAAGPPWHFVTGSDAAALAPVLAAYDQTVVPLPAEDAPEPGLAHVLRVYLIDEGGTMRNVYGLDFLDPRLVLNDVRTLLLEAR
jgi:protein SCO1